MEHDNASATIDSHEDQDSFSASASSDIGCDSANSNQIATQHWIRYPEDTDLCTMSSGSDSEDNDDDKSVTQAAPQGSVNVVGTATKIVPRDYLPANSGITSTHVAAAFPNEYHKASEKQRESWLATMNKERQDCRSWAALKVEQIFVEEAHAQGLRVDTLSDIKLQWMKDGSDEMACKMFMVLYGTFDARPNWARVLESEYMSDYANIAYNKDASTVGCFESLISHKKSAMVVTINNATKATHNRRINISRPKEMITDDNRFNKRKKGVFDTRFVIGNNESSMDELRVRTSKKVQRQVSKKVFGFVYNARIGFNTKFYSYPFECVRRRWQSKQKVWIPKIPT